MVSRENFVILVFVAAALPLGYAIEQVTGQFVFSYAAVLVFGVVVPTVINEYLDAKRTDS
jgi:hypothetical protein